MAKQPLKPVKKAPKAGATPTARKGSSALMRDAEAPLPSLPPVQAPIPLSAVLGQERAVAVLSDAIRSGRIHHAWLFHGPFGVGKFTTALAFAATILDPTSEQTFSGEIAPDPASRVQTLLRAGTHPDLTVVTKEIANFHPDKEVRDRKHTTIGIDVVRHFIIEPGRLAPQVSGGHMGLAGRVFIIDEAEFLNNQSQNAILKFLEEPPPRTVLILVCANPESLLPTIRSRCQRVGFGTLPPGAIQSWSKLWAPEIPATQRNWLVSFGAGSPGACVRAHQMEVFSWWQRIAPMLEQAEGGRHAGELGAAMYELTDAWAKARVEGKGNESKEVANAVAAEWMFRLLAWRLGERLRAAADSAKGDPEIISMQIDAVRTAEGELESNVNMQFVMEKLGAEIAAVASGAAGV